MGAEKVLEDEGGGDLIDDAGVLPAGMAGLVEDLVGFVGGEALILKVEGQAGELGELEGEGAGFFGLGTGLAGEQQGKADDEAGDFESAGEAGEGAQVLAAAAAALEGEHGLGGEAELVRDGDADAAAADVEGQITGWFFLGQNGLPSAFSLKPRWGGERMFFQRV